MGLVRKERVHGWGDGRLKEKLNRLLKEAAQVSVDLDRADGTITGVPIIP